MSGRAMKRLRKFSKFRTGHPDASKLMKSTYKSIPRGMRGKLNQEMSDFNHKAQNERSS